MTVIRICFCLVLVVVLSGCGKGQATKPLSEFSRAELEQNVARMLGFRSAKLEKTDTNAYIGTGKDVSFDGLETRYQLKIKVAANVLEYEITFVDGRRETGWLRWPDGVRNKR